MIELNTITQGDCMDLIKEIPDHYINSIITDPPYFLGVTHNGQKGNYSDLIIMKPFFQNLFYQFKRVLKPDGCIYICCDWRTYPFLYQILEEYISIRNMLVWNKTSGSGSLYTNAHELIIFATERTAMPRGVGINILSGIKAFCSGAKKTNGEKIHPTQKPIELFEKFILDSTREGDVVLDVFAGSGTLAVAAIRTKRNYICFELQDKYIKMATERISVFKGEFIYEINNYTTKKTLWS
jgi:site-specific DNA-methyltransferase (adenine-specific)